MIAVICGLAISTAASAQTPTVNWTGFYIGGHGGYQWSTVDLGFEKELPGLGDGVSLNTDGAMGGIHGGVQQQFGNFVIGIELSGDWGNGDGSAAGEWGPVGKIICGFGCFGFEAEGAENVSVDIDSLFLATARTGYAWQNILVYAKGGFASAEIGTGASLIGEAEFCVFGCLPFEWNASGSTEKRHNGFALGGGIDWMIWQNVSVGLDYTYVNLSSETHRGTLNGDVDFCGKCGFDFAKDYKIKVDPDDIHYVNARLTFHFNSASP